MARLTHSQRSVSDETCRTSSITRAAAQHCGVGLLPDVVATSLEMSPPLSYKSLKCYFPRLDHSVGTRRLIHRRASRDRPAVAPHESHHMSPVPWQRDQERVPHRHTPTSAHQPRIIHSPHTTIPILLILSKEIPLPAPTRVSLALPDTRGYSRTCGTAALATPSRFYRKTAGVDVRRELGTGNLSRQSAERSGDGLYLNFRSRNAPNWREQPRRAAHFIPKPCVQGNYGHTSPAGKCVLITPHPRTVTAETVSCGVGDDPCPDGIEVDICGHDGQCHRVVFVLPLHHRTLVAVAPVSQVLTPAPVAPAGQDT